jgi:aminopeptidase N
MLSTQMEATDARRMFPCWDEPAFRATFRLEVNVPAAWASVSNMPIEQRVVHGEVATVRFGETPRMPSYLIELTAGDLREVTGKSGATDMAVWTVAGEEQQGETALHSAEQILADYNAYFAYAFPLPKLDSIAVPGGFSGAMENWGAITYNDQTLLVGAASSAKNRQLVFSIQAHEMAHQWFGDLVTMGWWDEIWLNESFASWLGTKETAARNPSWHWWESEDSSKEIAMRADARPASHAIEQHVANELQAEDSFDPDITYSKGQALLRMLENYLGEDVFRDGLRRYMRARAYSNATAADLWQALNAASGKDVAQLAAQWTTQPGFPLISVNAACDASGMRSVSLHQNRFLLSSTEPVLSRWRIPLRVRAGGDSVVSRVLFDAEGQQVPAGRCDQTLSINADAVGYYRVRYDAATLGTNTAHFATGAAGDRIALLDDQWALVEAGQAPLASYLPLAAAMQGNFVTRAWQQISAAFAVIEYAERGSPGHGAFTAFARSTVESTAARLGWAAAPDETADVTDLRRTLIADLGSWDDPQTVAQAKVRFAAFLTDRASLAPDLQPIVLGIVAQNADAATFAQLHALARQADNETERERFYASLAAVRDPLLARQVAQIAISDELPPQAASLRLQLVLRLADRFPQLSWETFTTHRQMLVEPFPMLEGLIISQTVPGVYWDAMPASVLEAWVKANLPADAADTAERGMQAARFKIAEKQSIAPAADAYLQTLPQAKRPIS